MSQAAQFDDFVAAQGGRLVRAAYLMTGNWADAEDAVQSALMRCYRHWRRFDREGADPAAYVYRAVTHATIDIRRRPWQREAAAEVPELAADDTAVQRVLDRVDLHQTLRSLPPRERAVVVLRYWADMSVADVADVLGCPQETVRTLAARGLVRLRAALVDEEKETSS
jgi:RNA polymerase sigma-70 factor (sigma-E family)